MGRTLLGATLARLGRTGGVGCHANPHAALRRVASISSAVRRVCSVGRAVSAITRRSGSHSCNQVLYRSSHSCNTVLHRPTHRPSHCKPSPMAAHVASDSRTDYVNATDPTTSTEYPQRWEKIWSEGLPPGQGWDVGHATPAWTKLLTSGALPVTNQRCIVPGFGRGYDLFALAAHGAQLACGLELSATALAEAQEQLKRSEMAATAVTAVELVQGDFLSWQHDGGPFDVGFDYTFGCAMHPSMREAWAASWARLMRPGGTLVTLVFPVDPAADPNVGPPFPVSLDLYTRLLSSHFSLVSANPVDSEVSIPKRAGREWLAIWQRK